MRTIHVFALLVLASAVAGCGGSGGGGESPEPQPNTAPQVAILASGQVSTAPGTPNLVASVGAELSLSGATSTDAERDILSFKWRLVSRPAGSTLTLSSDTTALISFSPDRLGNYELSLRVTDTRGAFSDKAVSILVDNSAPASVVVITATYSAVPVVKPTQTVSIGASILLDATGSTDVDGDVVTSTWTLAEKPAGSAAALTITGQTARFSTDAPGIYRVGARGEDPLGAYSETIYVFDAQNRAPNAVLLATISPVVRNSGTSTMPASVGYDVVLSGAGSTDPDGNAVSMSWSMESRPAASTASLSAAAGSATQFAPDVLGNYVVRLTVTDPAGASAIHTTTLTVNNNRPVASIATNATPVSLPMGPSIRVPIGTQITLRGDASSDADGDPIAYEWSIVNSPPNSVAQLTSPSTVSTQFTPDRSGSYLIRLRATDSAGAWSDGFRTVLTGNYPPVAVVDKNRVTVISGGTVSASAALSYDEDGDALTYDWQVDTRPAGSAAVIASPASSALSFTPDVPGTYVVTVQVRDGQAAHDGIVIIRALANVSGSVSLPFAPLEARYSRGLDRLILSATNPNSLRIVDPFGGAIRNVILPWPVKALNLSPDGRLAAVLHEGQVSLVDLEAAQIVRTSLTGGSQTDVFVQNDAFAYLIGQTGGQWVTPPVTVLDLRTGASVVQPGGVGFAFFYGTQRGVYADRMNRVFFIAYGLSPVDISWFAFDPATHVVTAAGDSIYHGDWPLGQTFYLSQNQNLLFTSAGTYFQTEPLRFAGNLALAGAAIRSMSHSSAADEALVLQQGFSGGASVYNAYYRRFYGALFLADADIPLPQIGGQQSYGIEIFHSANDNHVVLVQTGSDVPLDSGVQYAVIYR